MGKINLKNTVKTGPFSYIPKLRYFLRGLEQKFGKSASSDNPQITFDAEIVCGPDGSSVVEDGGQKFEVAGKNVRYFITFSEKNLENCCDFFRKMGHEEIAQMEDFDPENPPPMDWLKGILFEAILEATPRVMRLKSKVPGKLGEPMKDSNGKDIINGYELRAQLQDILGVVNELPTPAATTPY